MFEKNVEGVEKSFPAVIMAKTVFIDGKDRENLMKICKGNELSLFVFLLTGVVSLQIRQTGNDKAQVYTRPPAQSVQGTQQWQTLLVESEPASTFSDLLMQTKDQFLQICQNHSTQPDKLQAAHGTYCLLSNIHGSFEEELPDAAYGILFTNEEDRLTIRLEYQPEYHTEREVELFLEMILSVLRYAAGSPKTAIHSLRLMTEEQECMAIKKLLRDMHRSAEDERTIQELFEEQAMQYPDYVFLRDAGTETTYRQLNEEANKVANYLVAQGLGKGKRIGVLAENSVYAVIGILGVMKAGAAFLYLDPHNPEMRNLSLLEDSQTDLVLTTSSVLNKISIGLLMGLDKKLAPMIKTATRPSITDLDHLPIPDRSLVDNEKYNNYIGLSMVKHNIAIQATRGCPYQCAYCHKIWPKLHIKRSAQHIFQEIKTYYDIGIRRFVFVDDIFNLDLENSGRLFRMLIDHGMKVQIFFPNGLRGDLLTEPYIDLMVQAGVVNIGIALETTSKRLQKMIQKNMNLEKLHKNLVYIAEKYPQVLLDVFIMHGFPTETEEEALEMLEYIKSIKWLHFANLNILKIYPNTEMESIAIENGVSKEKIAQSAYLGYHELPDTLPFSKNFTRHYQSLYLTQFFLSKERLLNVLPHQMRILTEDELIQKYNSFLPAQIESFDDLLSLVEISREELGDVQFLDEQSVEVPDLNRKLAQLKRQSSTGGVLAGENKLFTLILLDVSQLFTHEYEGQLYNIKEPPLGCMYLGTYLQEMLPGLIEVKICKPGMDYESYEELREILKEYQPDLIGLRSLTFYRDMFHKTLLFLREWGWEVPIIAGGPYVTSSYDTILQDPNFDIAVLGEGEITFFELIQKMIENSGQLPAADTLHEIPGLVYADRKALGNVSGTRHIVMLDNALPHSQQFSDRKNPSIQPSWNDPAYVIYTSGTTGYPKGVVIPHSGLKNYTIWANRQYGHGRTYPLYTSLSFDLTYTSLFAPLISKGQVVLYRGDDNALVLKQVIEDNKVDIIKMTPTHLKLCEGMDFRKSQLSTVILGGENLEAALCRAFDKKTNGQIKLINEYGPTETVVGCVYQAFDRQKHTGGFVPIGTPIDNVMVFVVDDALNMVPQGITGELCIAGASMALGYLNRPDLTHQKFVADTKISEETGFVFYRTGDIARICPDSIVECLGRKDDQVKIRGYRIEPEEISNVILRFGGVSQAAVVSCHHQLHAFYVSENEIQTDTLKSYLAAHLPFFMVPETLVRLPGMPVTQNGKTDVRVLNEMVEKGAMKDGGDHPVADMDNLLQMIEDIWKSTLKMPKVGHAINFFEAGGNSMLLIQLHMELNKILDVQISLSELFLCPTIHDQYVFLHNRYMENRQNNKGTKEQETERLLKQVRDGDIEMDKLINLLNN